MGQSIVYGEQVPVGGGIWAFLFFCFVEMQTDSVSARHAMRGIAWCIELKLSMT